MESLTASQLKNLFLYVSQVVIDSKEQLCEADRNIGDGDHGIGMANGFEAAKRELEVNEFSDVYAVFSTVGRTMIKVMGGASGIIFGLLFYAGSKNMNPEPALTTAGLVEIFEKALAEIKLKGQAKLGDKTLIDGLEPMVEAMQAGLSRNLGFSALLNEGFLAAESGKEKSKQYIAKVGKAKTLGERAIGYPDAGCVTLTIIIGAMRDWVNSQMEG